MYFNGVFEVKRNTELSGIPCIQDDVIVSDEIESNPVKRVRHRSSINVSFIHNLSFMYLYHSTHACT